MKKAFTLIELLVVIAIIAILAAILFPVFAQAKAAAKKSSDLSNVKQIGTAFQIYTADYDDVLPSAYFHRAFNPALGGTRGGYIHFSGMLRPYVKNDQIWVSPGDAIGGHGPTCFATANNNSGKGFPGGQQGDRCPVNSDVPGVPSLGGFIIDDQVPRLSYTVNSAVMPRLRNIRDVQEGGIRVISTTSLDNVSGTIALAGLIDNLSCLNGQSLGTGLRNSSHRSTNAASRDAANRVQYLGENTDGSVSPLYALNAGQVAGTGANDLFSVCKNTPSGTLPLITYHSARRWGNGDNYGMADSSARFAPFAQTISPSRYMWGDRMYTAAGQQLLDPISGNPVTN
ncbi:MAG: prepilin-type N-terminal cleavage/methylation domain-containing protein [Fimbriimonadaceae bacterium]|nr:prepilin-type N-terminal cleavage/methylation domain-containing protein [Fimbriimonadaceae bacterium]